MKKYVWKYTEEVHRTNSDGSVGIILTSGSQQIIDFLMLAIDNNGLGGDDAGGTSKTSVFLRTDSISTKIEIMNEDLEERVILPNQDYLSTFSCTDLTKIPLLDGDAMIAYRTFIPDLNGSITFEIRALLSSYELPTITYYDSMNNARGTLHFNEIVAEVKE